MRAFALALLLVASALCAPQQAKDSEDSQEKKGRQLYEFPAGPFPFGARVSVPASAYSSRLAYPNQGFGYFPAAPQAFYPGIQPVTPLKKITYKAPQPVVPVDVPLPAPIFAATRVVAPASSLKAVAPVPALKAATAQSLEPIHVIVKQVQEDNYDGSFSSSYETDRGTVVESSGFLKNAGTPDEVQVIQGSYTYISPDGLPIITTYIADENGFQVQGDHLPVAPPLPPLPEAIAKAIEYQRSLPPSAEDLQESDKKP